MIVINIELIDIEEEKSSDLWTLMIAIKAFKRSARELGDEGIKEIVMVMGRASDIIREELRGRRAKNN